jgi:PAS domain S-box-containing protein
MKEESPSILIVEGENTVAKDLESSLAGLGYRIAGVVGSGHEAIRVAEEVRPDLALMDMQLAGSVDSLSAAGEIRNRLKIPIVFLMARSDGETVSESAAIAPYGYVAKPFRSTELNATILLALNQHWLVQGIFAEQAGLATMLESLNDAVIATDNKGRVSFLNPPAETLTGWPLKDVIGLPIGQIYRLKTLNGEQVEESQLGMALHLRKATERGRFLLTDRTGRSLPIEESAAPIVEQGRLLGAVAVFRDITEVFNREDTLSRERDSAEAQMHITAEALGQTQSDLRSLSEHLIKLHEEERRHLAKNFHDDFSQRSALIGLQIECLAETLQDNPAALEQMRAIRAQLTTLSEGLRQTSHNLYPSVLSDLGFLPAVRELVQEFQTRGLDVTLRVRGTIPEGIPTEIGIALYRIAEEAIANAAKHAKPAPIHVTASVRDATLQVVIQDCGSGFDLRKVRARGGLGLLRMQERARMAGGSLFVGTAAGQGTQVIVRVPVG